MIFPRIAPKTSETVSFRRFFCLLARLFIFWNYGVWFSVHLQPLLELNGKDFVGAALHVPRRWITGNEDLCVVCIDCQVVWRSAVILLHATIRRSVLLKKSTLSWDAMSSGSTARNCPSCSACHVGYRMKHLSCDKYVNIIKMQNLDRTVYMYIYVNFQHCQFKGLFCVS